MEESRKSLYVLLTIQTLRTHVDAVAEPSSVPASELLPLLGKSIQEYEAVHHYQAPGGILDIAQFRSLVATTGLKRLLSVEPDDQISLDRWMLNFKSVAPEIVAECSMNYSEVLLRELDDLKSRYLREMAAQQTSVDAMDVDVPADAPKGRVAKDMEPAQLPDAAAQNEHVLAAPAEPEPAEGEEDSGTTASEPAEAAGDDVIESVEKEVTPAEDPTAEAEAISEVTSSHGDQEVEEIEQEAAADTPERDSEGEQDAPEAKQAEMQEELAEESETQPQPDSSHVEESAVVKTESGLENTVSVPTQSDSSELKPTEPTPEHEGRKRPKSPFTSSQKRKRFQNIAVNLIKTIEEHRFSSPFLTAVSAKNYEDVIYEPKDLKSILKNIKHKDAVKSYETVKDLERDIMLMFANCVMFNKSSTPLVDMAKEMKDDVRETFKMFEEAESEMR